MTIKRIACFVEDYNFKDKAEVEALYKFKTAAESLGNSFDFIYKKDIDYIKNYDALFIRSITDPNNISYVASLIAEQNGLKVIDDTHSINICCNKAITHEIFLKNNIPYPKASLFYGDYSDYNLKSIFKNLKFPIVIKTPNTCFSLFVEKANNESEFIEITKKFLKNNDVLVLQEFIISKFDWRVGILDNDIIFLCKYYLAEGDWRISTKRNGETIWGRIETISRELIDPKLKDLSIQVSKLVGKGLYGLDIKETPNGYIVIEINENPSIYSGDEDKIDSDIYEKIIKYLTTT